MVGKIPIDNETDAYWMRQKLNNAVVQLRDIEDYYRPKSDPHAEWDMNGIRADRVRDIYMQIIVDIYESRPTWTTITQKVRACSDTGCTICEEL